MWCVDEQTNWAPVTLVQGLTSFIECLGWESVNRRIQAIQQNIFCYSWMCQLADDPWLSQISLKRDPCLYNLSQLGRLQSCNHLATSTQFLVGSPFLLSQITLCFIQCGFPVSRSLFPGTGLGPSTHSWGLLQKLPLTGHPRRCFLPARV